MENTKHFFDCSLYDFSEGKHRNRAVIWIKFPPVTNLIVALRKNVNTKWSASQKCWYAYDTALNRSIFNMEPKILGKNAILKIQPHNFEELVKFKNFLVLKSFSTNTMRTYCNEFSQLLMQLQSTSVKTLSKEKLQSYFLYCHQELQLSENQIHSRMNAIKFYFEKVLHKDKMFFDIPRPKKKQMLPKYLNHQEILKIFEVTQNLKHRIILQLSYGMGLRVSEIVNLKIVDIDSVSLKVRIEQSKGKKDRYVNLPISVLEELRSYYKEHRPKVYLFENKDDEKMSIRTVQNVFRTAMDKANIHKTIGIHGLRHSYATHLLEYGTDVALIQKLLGHNDIKTTLVYTNVADKDVAKVVSPLDRMK